MEKWNIVNIFELSNQRVKGGEIGIRYMWTYVWYRRPCSDKGSSGVIECTCLKLPCTSKAAVHGPVHLLAIKENLCKFQVWCTAAVKQVAKVHALLISSTITGTLCGLTIFWKVKFSSKKYHSYNAINFKPYFFYTNVNRMKTIHSIAIICTKVSR